MDGYQSMMKSVLDDLQWEPQPGMWQKFDNKGIVHKEFVPPGKMVNGKFYCNILRRLRENFRRKRPDWRKNSWALHHDNALAQASLNVQQFFASIKMTVIPHPPYSLDLATCEFFLFPKMKLKLKGRCYDGIEEIQTESQNVKTLTWNAFQKCFQS
jgi:hypothetical protein